MQKSIYFYKYQGTGNDFIIIDNRGKTIFLTDKQISNLCHRNFGIGADGLMLIENEKDVDFKMRYFNSDGAEGTLCGNGSRCITRCVYDLGLIKKQYTFNAADGNHLCLKENEHLHLHLNFSQQYEVIDNDYILNTGSPHYVFFDDNQNIETTEFIEKAKKIRFHEKFVAQRGINVNQVQILDDSKIRVRTYERGVENETLSCGTGVTAASIAYALRFLQDGQINIMVETLGGQLQVSFEKKLQQFTNIFLIGPAQKVFEGNIFIK